MRVCALVYSCEVVLRFVTGSCDEPCFRILSVSPFSKLPVCNPHASWRKVGLQGESQPHTHQLSTHWKHTHTAGSAVKQTGDIVACGSVGWPAGPASGCHLHPPAGPL